MPTWHLQDWPASTCLRPNVLELPRHAHQTSRLLQLHVLIHPGMSRPPKNCLEPLDPSRMIWSSSGTPGMPGKPGKVWPFWKTIQNTQYIGLGPPSWFTPTPQYVAHVCYLTTHRAHQRHPVGLPSSRSGDKNEWYNPGATKPN